MKIVYLVSTSEYAGAENMTILIARHMKERHEVWYCSPDGPIREYADQAGIAFLPAGKITPGFIKSLRREYVVDLFHACDYRMSTLCALAGVRFVAHLHNNSVWLGQRGLQSRLMLFFSRRACRVLCVSRSIIDEYVYADKIRDKCIVLENVLDIEKLRSLRQTPNRETAYELCFIGRLAEPKDPLRFLDIVRRVSHRIPGLRAVMIGDGNLRVAVERRIAEWSLESTVTLTGFLADPFPVLRQCRVVVMPSLWEGFGLTAVESMALGKPVLASPVGGLKTVVNADCGALCVDAEDYAEQAQRLLTDETLYSRKAAAAIERAEAYGNIGAYIDRLQSLYGECLS